MLMFLTGGLCACAVFGALISALTGDTLSACACILTAVAFLAHAGVTSRTE